MANGVAKGVVEAINLGLSIAIIVYTVRIYNETKKDLDPLQEYDISRENRTLLSSSNPSSLKNNVQISNYCQCGEEILNNVCTEEQIIKGCYDITKNDQNNLLRNLVDQQLCNDVISERKNGKGFAEIFKLNYKTVSKMALGILIIYCCLLGAIALVIIMAISFACCQEAAACCLIFLPIVFIVFIFSGVANLVLFIIMLVNFYKGRTTGEFLDFYNDCNYEKKDDLAYTAETLKRIKNYMTVFIVLNSIAIFFNYVGAVLNKQSSKDSGD